MMNGHEGLKADTPQVGWLLHHPVHEFYCPLCKSGMIDMIISFQFFVNMV
jgi:hypothetical protein